MSARSNTPEDTERLVEALAGAWRPQDPRRLGYHPAFYDLDDAGRVAAFDRAVQLRQMESALDPEGLSTTVRAIIARINN